MKEFILKVQTGEGLSISKIEELIKILNGYSSDIYLVKGDRKANARLIFNLLSLGVNCGDTVTVQLIGGNEEAEAISLMEDLHQLL